MKQSYFRPGPQPQFEAQNLEYVAHLRTMGRLSLPVYYEVPKPAQDVILATRAELVNYALTTDTLVAVAFRGWRRLQALYTAKVQFQTVGLASLLPLETPIDFRNNPPLPTIRPNLSSGWTAWEMSLEQLDAHSLQAFMHQIKNQPGSTRRNQYADLLGVNSGPRTVDLLTGFAELKLAGAEQ